MSEEVGVRSEENNRSEDVSAPHPSPLTPHSLGRLRWHCRRGMLELDLVLARFLEENYARLTARQRKEFEQLLELPDQELWQLVRGDDASASTVIGALRGCQNR